MADLDSSQASSLEEIETAELHRAFIEEREIDVHTALIARVDSYDASAGTVGLTIMQNRMVPDGDGGWVSDPLPAVSDVPVQWVSAGGFAITLDLAVGDTGALICCERSLATWRATGTQCDPGDLGLHTLDGAFFVPGIWPDKSVIKNAAPSGEMRMGHQTNGSGRIHIKASEIALGAAASDFVAMAAKTLARLSAIVTGHNAHTHPYTNGITPATTSAPTTPLTAPAAVASTNAKAEG